MPVPACLQHPLSSRLCGRVPQPQPLRSCANCRNLANIVKLQKRSRCRASAEAQTDEKSELQIEGIEQNYCDDFVCTSSPAVERNLRALARDVGRTSTWTTDLFADEVRYKVKFCCTHVQAAPEQLCTLPRACSGVQLQDQFRSTEGIAQYQRQTYLAGAVKEPKVVQDEPSAFVQLCTFKT